MNNNNKKYWHFVPWVHALSLKLLASSCYLNKKEKPHPSEPVFYLLRSHPFLIFTMNSGSVIKRPELELMRAEGRVLLGLQQAGKHRDTHRWGMVWAAPSGGQAGDTAISQGSRELLGEPSCDTQTQQGQQAPTWQGETITTTPSASPRPHLLS